MTDPTGSPAPESLANIQFWPDGRLRHLLTIQGLSQSAITDLLDRADSFLTLPGTPPVRSRALAGRTVANLFFEPSTRTRASFELAAKRLSADVLNLDVNTSSRIKGESILDTIYTLQAMQCDIFVVRDAETGVPAMIAHHVEDHVAILNAGESDTAHPTQGLLDLLTIRQSKGRFEHLKVAIVGDIAHSRVARSAAQGLNTMGVSELRLISPRELAPLADDYPGASLHSSLREGIEGADVIMALRIQRERIGNQSGLPSAEEYYQTYGITPRSLELAADDAIVMHPGPMNRNVEIDGAVADGPQSAIERQVTNGLAVRMAVLAAIAQNRGSR